MFTIFHDKTESELLAIIRAGTAADASTALATSVGKKSAEQKTAEVWAERDKLIAQQELAMRVLRIVEDKLNLSDSRRALKKIARKA